MDRNRLSSFGGFGKPSRIPGLGPGGGRVSGVRDSFIPVPSAPGGGNRVSDHRLSGLTGNVKQPTQSASVARPQYGNTGNGAVGGTQMTSRFSMRPSNLHTSLKKKLFSGAMTPQGKARPSMNPSSVGGSTAQNRRNSLIGERKHLKETRQLSDPSWQTEACAKLIQFLGEQGYPHKIPDKLRTSPQQGDLVKIYEFLFGYFSNKVQITRLTLETMVPKLLKLYGYPFQVQKSTFSACTTKMALGHLFGTFDWLVNALTYMLNYDCEKAFHRGEETLLKLALGKMAGTTDEDDIAESLEKMAVQQFGSQEEYMKLLDELEQLKLDQTNLEKHLEEENQLPRSLDLYTKEVDNHIQWVVDLEKHKTEQVAKLEEMINEIEQMKANVNELTEQLASLDSEVKAQEFGADEAEMARARQKQLDSEIADEIRSTEELKREIRVARLNLSKLDDEIRRLLSQMQSYLIATRDGFGSHASKECLKPVVELINDKKWDEVLEAKNDPEALDKLSSLVNELKLGFKEQRSLLEDSPVVNKEEKLKEIDDIIKDLEKESTTVETLIERLKTDNETIRREYESEMTELGSELELNRKLLSEMDDKLECSEREKKERVKALRRQVSEATNRLEATKKEILRLAKEKRDENIVLMDAMRASMRRIIDMESERIRKVKIIYEKNDELWEHVKQNTRPRTKATDE